MIPAPPTPYKHLRRQGEDLRKQHRSSSARFAGIPAPPLFCSKPDSSNNGVSQCLDTPREAYTDATAKKCNAAQSLHPGLPRSPRKVGAFIPLDRASMSPYYHSRSPLGSPAKGRSVLSSPTPSLTSITSASESSVLSESHLASPNRNTGYGVVSPSTYPKYFRGNSGYDHSWPQTPQPSPSPRRVSSPSSPYHLGTPQRRSPTKQKRASFVCSPASEDASRKQRVKTELCLHYLRGKVCPFGINCTYAHGEEELQKTKLNDMQRAGLIDDVTTYRTRPCLTWVATGSCPFGKRCSGIHDPRVGGAHQSWLPHTETQGNSISTDINVDALHQQRLGAILHCNPFGDQFSLELDDWADLAKLVCNTSTSKRRRSTISEIHKLSIAIQMRGEPGWMYKYRPGHFISSELCMVLQKCAFALEKSGAATPLKFNDYNPARNDHVLVRELAFGPDSDSTVRGVALWFNIPEQEVVKCTPHQAKRFRWKKAPKYNENQERGQRSSVFDSRECFFMIRPHDRDAFELATDILLHRFQLAKADRLTALSERSEALIEAKLVKNRLHEKFSNHKRHWESWAWPMNVGRQITTDDTPVPPVDGQYEPLLDPGMVGLGEEEESVVKGSSTQPIWESFVSHGLLENGDEATDLKDTNSGSRPRLPVFVMLGKGGHICRDRSLPHIHQNRPIQQSQTLTRQSERCWRSLLAPVHGGACIPNDWEVVREHFQQHSRCKKVLTIIQQ